MYRRVSQSIGTGIGIAIGIGIVTLDGVLSILIGCRYLCELRVTSLRERLCSRNIPQRQGPIWEILLHWGKIPCLEEF